jgi:hypothetical protein
VQRADKRKYHYIYKITRDDGRYYIGMHSTDDLDDGYMGSGKKITRSIRKHGKERHKKEILELLPSRVDLRAREAELVNEQLLADPLCMNMAPGGGDWMYVHMTEAHKIGAVRGNQSDKRDHSAITTKIVATKRARGSGNWFGGKHNGFAGKTPTPEHRSKIGLANSKRQQGKGNSQYGTCWVKNDTHSIKIRKEQLDKYLEQGYVVGRKMKYDEATCPNPCMVKTRVQ